MADKIIQWRQEYQTFGQAINNWKTRKVYLNGTQTIHDNNTSTVQVTSIEVFATDYTSIIFYLDGKILVNNTQVFFSSSRNAASPDCHTMVIQPDKTVFLDISASSTPVIINNAEDGTGTFSLRMTGYSYSNFYWVNGGYQKNQWETSATHDINAYRVLDFKANGGSGSMARDYVAAGANYIVPSNAFFPPASTSTTYTITLKSNYTNGTDSTKTVSNILPKVFNTWRQNSTSGTALAPGTTITISDNITLYATWKNGTLQKGTIQLGSKTRSNTTATGYTVSFDTQGGSSVEALTSTKTTKYTFQGWMTSASGTEVEYDSTTSYSFTQDTTLYAKWSSTTTNGSLNLPAAPIKTGYNLLGWGISAQATTYKQPGESITPTKNMTYYAIWKAAGNIRIYVDGEYKMALAYIYPGSEWKPVIPYIKTPTDWKIIAG